MTAIRGCCLCGNVRYEVQAALGGGHCYCVDCRKSSGTSHCSHMIARDADVEVTGVLSFFETAADSGNRVRRGFCPTCGSAVYSTNSGAPGLLFVRASSLDDPNDFSPQMAVYTSRAPQWASNDDTLPGFDEMPPANARPA
ncbi:MAG: GFA family protein [Pseudomonadota bacterium]